MTLTKISKARHMGNNEEKNKATVCQTEDKR